MGALGKLPPAALVRNWGWAWSILLEHGGGGRTGQGLQADAGSDSVLGSALVILKAIRPGTGPCRPSSDHPLVHMIPQEMHTPQGALCTCVHAQNPKLILLSLVKGQECHIVCIDITRILCFVSDFTLQSSFIQCFLPSSFPPPFSLSHRECWLVISRVMCPSWANKSLWPCFVGRMGAGLALS